MPPTLQPKPASKPSSNNKGNPCNKGYPYTLSTPLWITCKGYSYRPFSGTGLVGLLYFAEVCYTFSMEIKDIDSLAELAKLDLSDTEKASLLEDLDGILDYVKQIGEVKVPDVDVEYPLKNVWREDQLILREFSREEILSQFPDSENGFVKVKKIL